MTAAHLAAAAAELTACLPRRLPVRRARSGSHDTRLADDSSYPAGGFTAITAGGATTGNLANLVTSELMYMDDDAPVDLFALRYAEGELLHFTRDDSVFRRPRHVIGFALAASLADARIKDRDLPWQRLILVLAVILAAVRWLAEWLTGELGTQALAVRIAFPPAGLAEERHIVAVLLAAEIARGTVVIVDEPCEATAAVIDAASRAAIADLVVFARGAPPPLLRGVRALHIDVAAPTPVVHGSAWGKSSNSDPWRRWCDAAEDLLRWLL
jgi:hypothetical protein